MPTSRRQACWLLSVLFGTAPLAFGQSGEARHPVVERYRALAIQGDLRPAVELFAAAPVEPEVTVLGQRFRDRFLSTAANDSSVGSGDPFVDGLVTAYRAYWRASLMGELAAEAATAALDGALRDLMQSHGLAAGHEPREAARAEAERRGFHALGGRTLPHFELMLWKTETHETFDVRLTDSRQLVEVVFLDDFVSRGWLHHASFGEAQAGGWADRERLYCVADRYDRGSESFRVSYLAHEARHFADYSRFPALGQADLEYRAKLTELALAESTLAGLLESFATGAAPNPAAPHPYAQHALMAALAERLFDRADTDPALWAAADPDVVRNAARALLDEHDRALAEAGAATTPGTLASP